MVHRCTVADGKTQDQGTERASAGGIGGAFEGEYQAATAIGLVGQVEAALALRVGRGSQKQQKRPVSQSHSDPPVYVPISSAVRIISQRIIPKRKSDFFFLRTANAKVPIRGALVRVSLNARAKVTGFGVSPSTRSGGMIGRSFL